MLVKMLYHILIRYDDAKQGQRSTESLHDQFHQYHQNEQSPLILTVLTQYKKDQNIRRWKFRSWVGTGTKNVAGLNRLMGSQP